MTTYLSELDRALAECQRLASMQVAQHTLAQQEVVNAEAEIADATRAIAVSEQCQALLVECMKISRQRTIGFVESIVTKALQYIFEDDSLTFQCAIVERRGLEVEFRIRWLNRESNLYIEGHPARSRGGSVGTVVATALRLVLLKTIRPRRRQILIMDEPGKNLNGVRFRRYVTWLKAMSVELKVQMILITHDEAVIDAADTVQEVILGPQGESQVVVRK
jgi:hypothetical protein